MTSGSIAVLVHMATLPLGAVAFILLLVGSGHEGEIRHIHQGAMYKEKMGPQGNRWWKYHIFYFLSSIVFSIAIVFITIGVKEMIETGGIYSATLTENIYLGIILTVCVYPLIRKKGLSIAWHEEFKRDMGM